jgi:hypothetical protein
MRLTVLTVIALALLATRVVIAEDESLTITTYYPSPYGVYNELQANILRFGTGKEKESTVCDSTKEGQVIYDDSENKMYICNGTKWEKGMGAAGGLVFVPRQTYSVNSSYTTIDTSSYIPSDAVAVLIHGDLYGFRNQWNTLECRRYFVWGDTGDKYETRITGGRPEDDNGYVSSGQGFCALQEGKFQVKASYSTTPSSTVYVIGYSR